jgi:hypothetical protein
MKDERETSKMQALDIAKKEILRYAQDYSVR